MTDPIDIVIVENTMISICFLSTCFRSSFIFYGPFNF